VADYLTKAVKVAETRIKESIYEQGENGARGKKEDI
jgi:hypothetical protein